jgi:hypothetical protein
MGFLPSAPPLMRNCREPSPTMPEPAREFDPSRSLDELLGYLNFSSGAHDPQFLANLNALYGSIEAGSESDDTLPGIEQALLDRLAQLARASAAFSNPEQAQAVIALTFRHILPAYREYHRDLLFHQPDHALWRPFLLGRAMQILLGLGSPWDELDRLVDGTLDALNDFIGYRPVPALHTQRRMEPYDFEWVAPVPLYERGTGVAVGRYQRLIETTLTILRSTSPQILRAAHFDPELLDELCFDPRAYDFDHPVNKRANYHFGLWDPHRVDGSGRYRRFVIQQVSLDGLIERVLAGSPQDQNELIFEAAAVLAGTILMASGTSGSGPDAHDSTVTLSSLLPIIAGYRDEFYRQLLTQCSSPQRERLQAEAEQLRQPFAGARQHLNHFLARRRASQLEHVHLARIFARMGYPEAARRQAAIVPVASARMTCEIRCCLSTAGLAIERGELDFAVAQLELAEDLLHRGIECGAIVDPWCMLGFQGQFSLFPSPENSVPDHRVAQLIDLSGDIFAMEGRLWSEAAARDESDLPERISRSLAELARWWDQFASTTVEDLESFQAAEAYVSALQVADAMKAWHQGGTAAGDIGFWRNHVQQFTSPRAYGLVVDALLAKRDFVAAMALLMQWLSQADMISLEQGAFSFHQLARRWLAELKREISNSLLASPPKADAHGAQARLLRRFFDLLEANADTFWTAPQLSLDPPPVEPGRSDAEQLESLQGDDDDPDDALFAAAYEDVVYRDSTGDGIDADMLEAGPAPATDYELDAESRRLSARLEFLSTVAALWRSAASAAVSDSADKDAPAFGLVLDRDLLNHSLAQAEENQNALLELLNAVAARKLPSPSAQQDALLEYDRRRGVKLLLIEQIIATSVETANAARLMKAIADNPPKGDRPARMLHAVLRGDAEGARREWPDFVGYLRSKPVLYVAPAKGGDPRKVIEAQQLQHTIRELLRLLPRLGMIAETCQLIQTARLMENDHPVGSNAVTEFDRLFETGYKALVETLVTVSADWRSAGTGSAGLSNSDLVDGLEQLTEALLQEWLGHSRTLRLTVLERILDDKNWRKIVEFIERYGGDLFTQPFLNLGNLRAILSGGVDAWFDKLLEDPETEASFLLLRDLDKGIPRADAVKRLTLVLESVVENYSEYRDYNNTTTQSDRGELLFTLLDFLRVRAQYERVAWQLKPVLLAHEILVRRGRTEAAEMWRRAIADRTAAVADSLEEKLAELPRKYGMRLPTISDRVAERFVRPLTIDRIRALVRPAIEEVRRTDPQAPGAASALTCFSLLEQECTELMQEPSGVGLEVPAWLRALEIEAETASQAISHPELAAEFEPPVRQRPLTADDVSSQLSDWQVVE